MTNTFHHDVFYDEIKDMKDFSPHSQTRLLRLPAFIIVPHARFCYIKPLIEEAFGTALGLKPEQILILAPLHSPVLEKDKGFAAIATPLKEASGKEFSVELEAPEDPDIIKSISYFQEEPACEELYPALAKTFPGVKIAPLLAAGPVKKLRKILSVVLGKTPQTLVLVSCNAKEGIQRGESGLQNAKGLCAGLWLEALGTKNWNVLNLQDDSSVIHFIAIEGS